MTDIAHPVDESSASVSSFLLSEAAPRLESSNDVMPASQRGHVFMMMARPAEECQSSNSVTVELCSRVYLGTMP